MYKRSHLQGKGEKGKGGKGEKGKGGKGEKGKGGKGEKGKGGKGEKGKGGKGEKGKGAKRYDRINPIPMRPEFQWYSVTNLFDQDVVIETTDMGYKRTNAVDEALVAELEQAKSQLDGISRKDILKARGQCNPLEMLKSHIFINRAALKAAELNWLFSLLDNAAALVVKDDTQVLRMADVGAGPGGFSEFSLWKTRYEQGLREGRKKKNTTRHLQHVSELHVTAVTLRCNEDFRTDDFHIDAPTCTFNAIYGPDGTGDLLDNSVVKSIHDHVEKNEKFHLYMADGGIDFSGKESHQETVIIPLLAAQLALGVETLVEGGTLVCKLYTVHLDITTALIYLVGSCFEKLTLVKPLTSRPANSEKYVVCQGFKGSQHSGTVHMIRQLADKLKSNVMCRVHVPYEVSFVKWLKKCNHMHVTGQLKGLRLMLKCIQDDRFSINPDEQLYNQYLNMWGVATKIAKRKRSRAEWLSNQSSGPQIV